AGSLEAENDRLRKLIGLGSRLKLGFIPAEALHGRGVRDETTVILSAGSRAGVSRLSPVIAPEGLVGGVDQVDPTMSHAMLWTHPDFRVSAMSPDGTAFGSAQSHLTGATDTSAAAVAARAAAARAAAQRAAARRAAAAESAARQADTNTTRRDTVPRRDSVRTDTIPYRPGAAR